MITIGTGIRIVILSLKFLEIKLTNNNVYTVILPVSLTLFSLIILHTLLH
jgi:hypothetical protein